MPDYLYLLGHQPECAVIKHRGLIETPVNEWVSNPAFPPCTCQPSVIEVRSGMAFDSETFTFVGRVIDA